MRNYQRAQRYSFLNFLMPMFNLAPVNLKIKLQNINAEFSASAKDKASCADTEMTKKTFSSLSTVQKGLLRKKCIQRLRKVERKSYWDVVTCSNSEIVHRDPIESKAVLELIRELKRRCAEEPGLFRIEGDRRTYKKIVGMICKGDKIDYSKYTILVLGSALKSYIRDYMDGYFDEALLVKITEAFASSDLDTGNELCRCLLFSMDRSHRECFIELQELMKIISERKVKTRMSLESLCNILSLTMVPQKSVVDVESIPAIIMMFKALVQCDPEDISSLLEGSI